MKTFQVPIPLLALVGERNESSVGRGGWKNRMPRIPAMSVLCHTFITPKKILKGLDLKKGNGRLGKQLSGKDVLFRQNSIYPHTGIGCDISS